MTKVEVMLCKTWHPLAQLADPGVEIGGSGWCARRCRCHRSTVAADEDLRPTKQSEVRMVCGTVICTRYTRLQDQRSQRQNLPALLRHVFGCRGCHACCRGCQQEPGCSSLVCWKAICSPLWLRRRCLACCCPSGVHSVQGVSCAAGKEPAVLPQACAWRMYSSDASLWQPCARHCHAWR